MKLTLVVPPLSERGSTSPCQIASCLARSFGESSFMGRLVFQKEPATGGRRGRQSEAGRIDRSRKSCQRPRSQDQNGRSPPKSSSTLAEGVGDLLAKRLQPILQGRPRA